MRCESLNQRVKNGIKILKTGAFWIGVAVLATCTNDAKEAGTSNQKTADVDTAQIPAIYHLSGRLGDTEVVMDIQEERMPLGTEERVFKGFYYYVPYGGPIAVYGFLEANGQLILTEQGAWEGEAHRFEGKWENGRHFQGKWYNGNGKDIHPFNLHHQDSGIVTLHLRHHEDSLKAFADWAVSPQLFYSLEWVEPLPNDSLKEESLRFLQKAIWENLLDTTLRSLPENKNALLAADNALRYADFMDNMHFMRQQGLLDSTATNSDVFLSANYTYSTSTQVYYNSLNLITLGFTDYYYTGGAHGMYATRVYSYDLVRQRRLRLKDVLKPGFEKAVTAALVRAVRLKFNLPDLSPLSTVLFEDGIQPNNNYGFTEKGVFFVYAPYEVAPYAAGEIELFVAFENIKEFVRPEWLERAGLKPNE
ncbi:MAG: DUF3298 domain-containing protein [Saprospiraceae bacterium]